MKIIFMGTPEFSEQCLSALIESKHEICMVITREDRPKNRGMALHMPPVKELALTHNIPVLQPKSLKSDEIYHTLAELKPDIIVVVAYGRLLPQRILDIPKYGCINAHASILPKYRGASPIQAAILNGEKETGVTIMQMDAGMDTGDILYCKKIEISVRDTAETLQKRLQKLAGCAIIEYLDILQDGKNVAEKQDETVATHAPIIKKEDGKLSFFKTNTQVANHIMGYSPWPGAFCELNGEEIKLYEAYALPQGIGKASCGEIISCDKEGVVVACSKSAVLIKEIQKPGKKRMHAADFFRGHPEMLNKKFC